MRRTAPIWILSILAMFPGSLESQQSAGPVLLPGTTLRVQLPPGWKLEPPRLQTQQHLLTTTGDPRYELWLSQTTPRSAGYSCMGLIGSLQAVQSLSTAIQPRPAFVPDVYLGSILAMTDVQFVCLSTGDSQIGVMVQSRGGNAKPEVLTPMLSAIADAALKQSAAIASPGRVKLPVLGIEIPLRDGVWGVRETTGLWGRSDVLGRAARAGSGELNITPFVFPVPGRCENLGSTAPAGLMGAASFVKERRYAGDRWFPGAWEQFPPPFKALTAYVCRNVGTSSIMVARIEHEKTAVPDVDLNVIRQLLDDIGNAAEARGISIPAQPAVTGQSGAGQANVDAPQVLSDTQGYNFAPYINTVMTRIRSNWYALMPPSAIKGETARVGTIFTITRQGTVTDLQLAPASGNQVLDKTAMSAIQISSPLLALPIDFKGDRLTLRVTFLYNLQLGR